MALPFSQLDQPGPSVDPPSASTALRLRSEENEGKGRAQQFTEVQRSILLRYFEEFGMVSTHRRNMDLMVQCAEQVGTSLERIKNWIGSEAVKRKRKAGILPRPKVDISGASPVLQLSSLPPPAKKGRKVNGYNVFFSNYVRTNPALTSDLKERNTAVAQKWAELSDDERKAWSMKAEALSDPTFVTQPEDVSLDPQEMTPEQVNSALIENTLLRIQEKFDLLQQLGFEGYAILINTNELQSHLIATQKGKSFHRVRQKQGKPLENPFIGFIFSEGTEDQLPRLDQLAQLSRAPPPALGLDTLQKSVMNAFSLKYKVATGKTDVPYDNLQALGCHVIGMPQGIPFLSPFLYNEHQLQLILASMDKIVFLRVDQTDREIADLPSSLLATTDVEISAAN